MSPAERGPPCPLYLPADLYYDRWEVVDGKLVGEYRDNRTGALVTDLPTDRFCVETSPAVRSLTQFQTSPESYNASQCRLTDIVIYCSSMMVVQGGEVQVCDPETDCERKVSPRHSDI